MPDAKDAKPPAPREGGSAGFLVILVAIAVVAYVALRSNQSGTDAQLQGVAMPPLEVHGWFNSPRPVTNESLRGKVVLVDCWFVDCPPCRAAMPELVEFNRRFRGEGLQLIGLTIDANDDARRADEFIKSVPGFDWPVGYGAQIPVIDILGIRGFPTLILFDKAGRAVWSGHSLSGLEQATLAALAK
jgi:thiol-disulfide isomerase/thioredoxin